MVYTGWDDFTFQPLLIFRVGHFLKLISILHRWICQYLPEDSKGALEKMLGSQDPITMAVKEYNWQLNTN